MTTTPSAALAIIEAVRSAIARADDPEDMPSATVIPRRIAHKLADALTRYDAEQAQQQKEKESKS